MPLRLILASRNLFHDRLRFVATTIGIVFSVVLVMVQMGLYLGFGRMVTTMIDHASADLWIVRKGTKCFEDPSLLDMRKGRDVLNNPNVIEAVPMVIGFADWQLPSGELTPVFIVGTDLERGSLDPWNIVDGTIKSLIGHDEVAVDRTYKDRLGITGVGSKAEIRGHTVHVGALTDGIRSFTTTPYVFVDMGRARAITGVPRDKASYFLVKLKPGADRETVREDLQKSVSDVAVLTPLEFRDRSHDFWLFGTGAGAALLAGAILGIIVGTVIVVQTLYSSTKDHLDEFATLRAIGSSNRYIYRVIIYQALINAVVGFCFATLIGYGVVAVTHEGALPVVITPALMVAVFALTVVMCIGAAFAAIMRVVRIDPVMVFTR